MHPSELERVVKRGDVMRTGISAAEVVGIHGGARDLEIYAPAGRRSAIVDEHALQPGHGPVLLRWIPGDLWSALQRDVAPHAAILVDLLEHEDPRARREAERALRRVDD